MPYDLTKISEHLQILNSHAEDLLIAIYNVKKIISESSPESTSSSASNSPTNASPTNLIRPQKLKLLTDNALSGVIKYFLKKFPEVNEVQKANGHNAFTAAHKEIFEELKPIYKVFVGCLEFLDASSMVLLSIEKLTDTAINPEINPDVANPFLNLVMNYVTIQLMLSQLGTHRKSITAAYGRVFTMVNGMMEPNYKKVSDLMIYVDKPHANIIEALNPISFKISGAICSGMMDYSRGSMAPADQLRRTGGLSLVGMGATTNLRAPCMEDMRMKGFSGIANQTANIVLGFLTCPQELMKDPNALAAFKLAVGYNPTTKLVRDELFNIQQEYENTIKSMTKMSKLKNLINDAFTNLPQKAATFHRDRREYIKNQLTQLISLCQDQPSIMGPKFPVVSATLGFARDEILCYFQQFDINMVSGKAKNSKMGQAALANVDLTILELIWLVLEMKKTVLVNKEVIQSYYVSFISKAYSPKLSEQVDSMIQQFKDTIPETVKELFLSLVDTIKNLSMESAKGNNLEALRVNWARLQTCMSLPFSFARQRNIPQVYSLMNEISWRTRFIDQLETYAEKTASLDGLYFYLDALRYHMNEIIATSNVNQVKYFGVFGMLGEEFLKVPSSAWSTELENVSKVTTYFLEEVYGVIGNHTAQMLQAIAMQQVEYSKQVTHVAALSFVESKSDAQNNKKQLATEKPPLPAWESALSYTNNPVSSLEKTKIYVRNLISSLRRPKSVTIYDVTICPMQYLVESFTEIVKNYLQSSVYDPTWTPSKDSAALLEDFPYPILKPTLFKDLITGYFNALNIIDICARFDFSSILKTILSDQTSLEAARKTSEPLPDQLINRSSPTKRERNKTKTINPNQTYLTTLATWYVDFAATKCLTGNVMYSPLRKCFFTRIPNAYRYEEFLDRNEILALCELVGPNGVKFMDERILKYITALASHVMDNFATSLESFIQLQALLSNETKWMETIRKMKGIDDYVEKLIALGVLLNFRSVLYESLETVMNNSAPHIHALTKAYHSSTWLSGVDKDQTFDDFSNLIGLRRYKDASLHNAFEFCKTLNIDKRVWAVLPYMFTALLTNMACMDAYAYVSTFDAHEHNGHCIADAFQAFTVCALGNVFPESATASPNFRKDLLNASSTVLLRLYHRQCTTEAKDFRAKDLDSIFIILYKFAESTKSVETAEFDSYLPYSLLRNLMSDFMRRHNISTRRKTNASRQALAEDEAE
ncbi:Nck-associated protein 1 [Paraphysoderma sedebokerense]|nr:Nck-associated protein 1 [Paraphysoderma sedebokerense]